MFKPGDIVKSRFVVSHMENSEVVRFTNGEWNPSDIMCLDEAGMLRETSVVKRIL